MAVAEAAPREFTGNLILPGGGMPNPVIFNPIWVGDQEEGKAWLARTLQTSGFAVADDLATPKSYHLVHQKAAMGPDGKNVAPAHYFMKGVMQASFPPGLPEVLDQMAGKAPKNCTITVAMLGGAGGDVPSDATAVSARKVTMWVLFIGKWKEPTAALREAAVAWVREGEAAVKALGDTSSYASLPGDLNAVSSDCAFTGNVQRLRALKDRYDPANVLHMNDNIPPSSLLPSSPAA